MFKNKKNTRFLGGARFVGIYTLSLFVLFLMLASSFFISQYFYQIHESSSVSILIAYNLLGSLISIGVFVLFCLSIFSIRKSVSNAQSVVQVLRQSRDRYALAISGSGEGLWDWDMKNDTVYFSEHWNKMLGYKTTTEVRKIEFWENLIHEKDHDAVLEALNAHISGARPFFDAKYRIRNNFGSFLWVYDRGRIVKDENGEMVRLTIITRDISNIKRAEDALVGRTQQLELAREKLSDEVLNTKKFQQAVESATDPIIITHPDGRILYTNNAWQLATGYGFTDVENKNFSFLYSEKTPRKIILSMKASMKEGEVFTSDEMIATRKDDTEYNAELSLFPVTEKGATIFYTALHQDVTKRKEIDVAKTEFVSLASHQLRTPLSIIRWYSEMLISGGMGDLNEGQKKYAQKIYDSNKRMIELVGALLNVSRIDLGTFAMNPKKVSLATVVKEVFAELDPEIKKKSLVVKASFEDELPEIYADPGLMRMVFQNLITNAIKYTPDNGRIAVFVKKEGESNIVFSVKDSGIGIPEEQKNKIFTKLFRADNARETDPAGTGLGLYIVKAIIEKSGGNIRFESKEGAGTTFYGIIPVNSTS